MFNKLSGFHISLFPRLTADIIGRLSTILLLKCQVNEITNYQNILGKKVVWQPNGMVNKMLVTKLLSY